MNVMPEVDAVAVKQDLWTDVLDQELSSLPDKHRAVIVLCDLEEKTRREAARQLGVAEGTVASRLVRARALLAKRLARQGVLLSAGGLATALSQSAASASVPASAVARAVNIATLEAAGKATPGLISAKLAALTEGVLKLMYLTRLKGAKAILLMVGLVAAGAGSVCLAYFHATKMDGGQDESSLNEFLSELQPRARPSATRRKIMLQAPPVIFVNAVAVSPDGSLIATAADGVRLYDARTGALRRVIGDAGGCKVAFSPDGRTLAAAGFHLEDAFGKPLVTLPLFDVQTGKRVQILAGHTEWETDAIAFSPDGKLFASTGTDKQILIWELATGRLRHRLADQPSRVPALAFSPDSATLASGGDRTIRLWDVVTGQLRRSIKGHRDYVCALAFAPDGQMIASAGCDWARHRGRDAALRRLDPGYESHFKIWNTATGDLQRTISTPGRLLSLALSPDGKSLACGIGKEVRLYDIAPRRGLEIGPSAGRVVTSHDLAVTSVAFTPDGGAIISGSHDHTAKRTTWATGRMDWQTPGHFEQVNAVALSKDGALLATGSSDGWFANQEFRADARCLGPGAVRLWDARTGRLHSRLGDPAEQVMAVALSPDGRRVASGAGSIRGSGIVHVWDTATGTQIWSTDDHTAEVLAIAYAPDGSSVATAAADGLVKLRDPATGAAKQTLTGHAGGATSLAFSADGAMLACCNGHGTTHLWEVRSGRLLRTCETPGSQVVAVANDPNHRLSTSLALSPDGGTLVTNAGGTGSFFNEPVRFWNTKTGKLRREFADKGRGAHPVALSPDGSILAAGGKTVKLWDLRTGNLIRELFGHLKITESITFSADGQLLVSGGSYGTTNIWEVATGRLLVTLFTFTDNRQGKVLDDWLAYHPDGYYDGSAGIERYLA
jgi:WD40 repeat protein